MSVSTPLAHPWPDQWLVTAALQEGLISRSALDAAPRGTTGWRTLESAGVPGEAILALACSRSATRPADMNTISPEAAPLMSREAALRLEVFPLVLKNGSVGVATANPLSTTIEHAAVDAVGRHVTIVTASPGDIARAQAVVYPAPAPLAPEPEEALVGDTSLPSIFAEALASGVSDIHFEPKAEGLLVRFRVDGALHDARRIPKAESPQLVRRLKVQAGLDISDSLRPQDGRISTTHEGRPINMRVSTLPLGAAGEKVVIRVLDSRVANRDLESVGYDDREIVRIKRLLELPEGLILVTGPTGSGKTSSLYAALRHVRRPDLNIVTVEDPIEYRIDGINQVQVNEKARMTFAASLRSILRQDPDVVLIGEMRDAETAGIAVKASMTGHLVLSTLHASDALSTLDRLYGMEIDTSALAAALKGIVGQRLVRTLCGACALPVALSELPESHQHFLMGHDTRSLRRPVGCAACRGTGYSGRTVVAEIFLVTPALQRAIARRAPLGELADLSREGESHTLWESGLRRVVSGLTSLHELLDNVAAPMDAFMASTPQADIDSLLASLLPPKGESRPVQPHGPPMGSAPERGTGGRVLLIDDDRAERRRVAVALSEAGYTVFEAPDGEAGLTYARRLLPDVIVTEVATPRLDAVGLLHALSDAGIPCPVVVTGHRVAPEVSQWLLELGVRGVVQAGAGLEPLLMNVVRKPA